jgi:integrase
VNRSIDGTWHASISLSFDRHGRRLRRHAQAQTRRHATQKLARLKADVRPPATVGAWARRWLEIVDRVLKPATARLYRGHLRYLEPIAGIRPAELTAEDLEGLYSQLNERRLSDQTVASAHRTIRSCLNEAARRGHLDRNPALVARPPPHSGPPD